MAAHLDTFLAHARALPADPSERAVRETTRLASLAWAEMLSGPNFDEASRFAGELDRLQSIADPYPELADRLRWYRSLARLLASEGPESVGRALRAGRQALADQLPLGEVVRAVAAGLPH